MKPLAIIPARGGSKRIPRKNIKLFNGKPVITFAIEAAIHSGIFESVLVSTDDTEIKQVVETNGAIVPFLRSTKNSDDFATTSDVLKEVLGSPHMNSFENACCIYPVNPFLTSLNLKSAYKIFVDGKYDSVFSAVKYDFPVQRSFVMHDHKIRFLFPENLNTRSQDLLPVFHDAGQFYFFKTSSLFKTGSLFTENSTIFEVSAIQAQDIDTETDWELAEIKYQRIHHNK